MDTRDGRQEWRALSPDRRAVRLDACRRRAREVRDAYGAFVELSPVEAMPTAGRLAGLPYAVKDMVATANRRPGCGLAVPPGAEDHAEATVLARLDRAGAVRIGFTCMTALAYEPSGVGTARNPWNAAFAPGGSSSGSAVAVATGTAVVALGSDTGGSVRIPAQSCGTAAWKPSAALVPGDGTMPLAPSLDTVGLLGQDVRDIAAVAAVLTEDAIGPANGTIQAVAVAEDALTAAEAPVERACREGLACLDGIGVARLRVDALDLLQQLGEEALVVMQAEAWRTWGRTLASGGDPALAKRMAKGGSIAADRLARSLDAREAYRVEFEHRLLADADVLALPVTPIRTPRLAEVDPASAAFRPRLLYALSAYCRFANYLGLPAVTLPVGLDDRGLPVALQLVARQGQDAALLAFAARLQEAVG